MTTIEERKNCEAARFHVEMSQGIITRMASNSSNCKNWCITVITAILALYASKDNCPPLLILVALIPNLLFYLTDCFYLGLERLFRKKQESFNKKINNLGSEEWLEEIYHVSSAANDSNKVSKIFISGMKNIIDGMKSFSTSMFYGFACVLILVAFVVLK